MGKLSSNLIGKSGLYFVAAELSRKGHNVTIDPESRANKIFCSNTDKTNTIEIRVKTNSGSERSWVLNQRDEDCDGEHLFYVLVNLNGQNQPDYFILPGREVADYIKEDHQNWLATPGKRGQKHRDNPVRKFINPDEKYLNRWDLLNL